MLTGNPYKYLLKFRQWLMAHVCEVCLLKEQLKCADSVPNDFMFALMIPVILDIVDHREFPPPLPHPPPNV